MLMITAALTLEMSIASPAAPKPFQMPPSAAVAGIFDHLDTHEPSHSRIPMFAVEKRTATS
jgi:hypothetical protein